MAPESNQKIFVDGENSGRVELCFTEEDWAHYIRSKYAVAVRSGMPSRVVSTILRSVDDDLTEIVGSGFPYAGLRSGRLVGLSEPDGGAWEVPEEFQPPPGHWTPSRQE